MTGDDHIHPQAAIAPGYLTNHAARAFNRLVDTALRPHGVSLSLLGPIMLLSWKGPMLQRDLVRDSAVKQPAMVAVLRKLEGMNLIQRSTTETDRRAAVVSLTSQGELLAEAGGNALIQANIVGLKGFSEADAAQLVSLLQRLIVSLEAADGTKHHT
ncbi:MarR family winged helix-turn-helix transcriptional regulator [Brevundimonas sp.]|jgi:MarR family transcriptional regulator for hemolysin|uniref:MarR family winged helix-turn-helix transcriptional regulator n=1 Tax=Brevundimonas sp. TaxID=1871086 RepID=UPI0037BEB0C7